MDIRFVKTAVMVDEPALTMLLDFGAQGKAYLNTGQADAIVSIGSGKTLYFYGQAFYLGNQHRINVVGDRLKQVLKKAFSAQSIINAVDALEGQYIGFIVDEKRNRIDIFGDYFAREDSFYVNKPGLVCLSTSLDFVVKYHKPKIDQFMLSHFFSVYGWYTPKGTTIYQDIDQLKVGEVLTIDAKGVHHETRIFKPARIEQYGEAELETYYQLLKESIAARSASIKGEIWISSSSGWDSSIILGMLVDLYGAKRVRMSTGSMMYSPQTGKINAFEIEKVKRIGKFYGITPVIKKWEMTKKSAVDYWKKTSPLLKSKHMYSFTGFNFLQLSDAIREQAAEGQVVFNGETSDSFHNFGFSQFCTFFHQQKSFTEFGDKMNCYLYGPSFFRAAMNGTHQKDKVYQIFQKMLEGVKFESTFKSADDRLAKYMLPLFYGSPRIPFANSIANPMIKSSTIQRLSRYLTSEYMPGLGAMNEQTIYAWICHLYHSMHSQGSTVNLIKHAMYANGHQWRSPFHDRRLVDFLSCAPESWGRGLDFNHVKYPLKWVAKHKIKFPYELLEQGPHSYLYDVIEGFSIHAEITYRSAMTSYFKDVLAQRAYRQLLDPTVFDINYIDGLVKGYLNNKVVKGRDFTNLYSLATLSCTGWY